MLLTSWLRQLPGLMARRAVRGWKQKPAASRQARRGVAASSQFIARAESLEERALLSSITVTSLADNTTGDGQVTLREAIQAANTDSAVDGSTAGSGADTIVFAPGLTSGGAATITLGESHLTISSDLTITGPGADLLIIDGHDATGIFYFDNTVEENSNGELSGIVKLSGMTLTRGAGFTGVSAGLGGAVTNFADATLTDMIISNSTGPDGGGIFNQGDMALVNCLVTGNKETSSGGGGIYNDGDMTIDRTTVSENQTVGDGGGIQNTGTLTITNSTISNNSADGDDGEGGGISNYFEGEVTVKNSTVSGNTSGLSGGGLFNRGGVTIRNSTATNNRSNTYPSAGDDTGGGGIFNGYHFDGDGNGGPGPAIPNPMTITNSIVANNFRGADGTVADDIRGGVTANYNFIGDETGAEITGSNNLNGDPMLGVLADNGGPTKTHALLANSPAIDAGDSVAGAEAGDFDQRGTGFSRSLGNGIDIGAFESGAESGPEENDAFDRVVFRFMSAKNVTIEKTSNGSTTTETVTNTDPVQRPELLAKEFVFELPNSSDAATLRDVTGTGIMRFGGSTFLDVLFNVTETTRLIVRGNKGNDSIKFASLDTAFHASVTLEGGDGADRLDASLLTLGTQLLGGLGNDTLLGSSGDDTITAGFGSDYIQGKLGTDTLIESGDVNFVLANSFLLGLGTDVINGLERVELTGGVGNNKLDASRFTNGEVTLRGLGGNDTLWGGSRNDSLFGDEGTDRVMQIVNGNQTLSDSVLAGAGNDALNSIERAWLIVSGLTGRTGRTLDARNFTGNVTLDGGAGKDTLLGGSGNDVLYGGDGNDLIAGGSGNDTVSGESGNDVISGQDGNDFLLGGNGDDTILGESGNDFIKAELGVDVVLGGEGDDTINALSQDTISFGPGIRTLIGTPKVIDETFTFDFNRLLP